jgi:hypothetical protein
VPNDITRWLRTFLVHKYTPNFESITWKKMVMSEQALEVQGVVAPVASGKMFEVISREDGVQEPNCAPGLPSGGPVPYRTRR